jgi:RHS repeat-associated protein
LLTVVKQLPNTYGATGNKLRRVSPNTGNIDYIGGIQYDGTTTSTISFIHTEEGRALVNGTGYNYEYNLGDNLGNTRVSFDSATGSARLVQQDDYYPFGMEINRSFTSPKNEYLYNKKELQEELGEYDYGARFYNPVIGRWNAIDELAENFEHTSPYVYVLNNPINLIDPDGRDTIRLKEVQIKEVKSAKKNDAEAIPITLPPGTLPVFRRVPPPNPIVLLLLLLFSPANSMHDHSEKDALDARARHMHLSKKTVDEILKDAQPGRETKGRVKQYEKDGGKEQADEDFDDIVDPFTIKPIPGGRRGETNDGTNVNVREGSSDGRPTLEVQNKNPIKVRYNEKQK